MKFLNFAASPAHIRAAFIVHKNEFNKRNIELNLLTFLPEKYRKSVVVLTLEDDDTNLSILPKLEQLPKGCVISVCDARLYKHIVHKQTLPKTVGILTPAFGDKLVQYFNFSSKALYLHANLNHNRKCIDHVTYYLRNLKPMVTKVERKLISPKTEAEVKKAFRHLMRQPLLGADVEATDLRFYKAKLVSISFAVSEQAGYTFHVKNCDFMSYLKIFFEKFEGRIAWHGGSYDLKLLTHLLFNGDGRTLFRTYEDTIFLHFICTNSPERFPRDLGTLVSDLCGEYKLTKAEITNMMEVPVQKTCEYNLDDARGTWWLYNKYRNQIHSEYLYDKMKKWQWYLTQTELAGIPFSWKRMEEVDAILTETVTKARTALMKRKEVIEAMGKIRTAEVEKRNAKRVNPIEEWEVELKFNPNSNAHLSILMFDVLGLTPVKKTPSGNPSVDSGSLKKMKVRVSDSVKEIFTALEDIAAASKMQSTFIQALKNHHWERNGWHYLHGSYNLARVVSGRLSSSDPNLQNLPSGSSLSKLFKSIFIAPKGFLWGGADYASLEERINTILTQDPNKRAVYDHGYDGHSYRAFYYFPTELQQIHDEFAAATTMEEKVKIINSIQDRYDDFRKKGKAPTFLLQYLGTAYGLVMTCGFEQHEADAIYENYYKLYKVSAKWLDEELAKVAETGYAEVAYGLRVYCYGISRAMLNSKRTPKAIQEFIRTLGNAIGGQSYGQLTVDAGYKFLTRVYDAGLQNDVFSVGTIHDADYLMWTDNPQITEWVNFNLIDCMMDVSEHPELQGDIPLPANLDIYSPSWDKPITLKSHTMTASEITQALEK